MSKWKFSAEHFERLQDQLPEVEDHAIKSVLDAIESMDSTPNGPHYSFVSRSSANSRIANEKRLGGKGDKGIQTHRRFAVQSLRELDLSKDPDVLRVGTLPPESLRTLLGLITQRAIAFHSLPKQKQTTMQNTLCIILPREIVDAAIGPVLLPVTDFRELDKEFQAFLRYLALVSNRLADEYDLEPEWSLCYLLRRKPVIFKDPIRTEIQSNQTHPGRTRIYMCIDPSTPPEEVSAEYANARARCGFDGKRTLRRRTYLLADVFASCVILGLIDEEAVDWRKLMFYWSMHDENGEPCPSRAPTSPFSDKDVYQFARDVRHAVALLRDDRRPPGRGKRLKYGEGSTQ